MNTKAFYSFEIICIYCFNKDFRNCTKKRIISLLFLFMLLNFFNYNFILSN